MSFKDGKYMFRRRAFYAIFSIFNEGASARIQRQEKNVPSKHA